MGKKITFSLSQKSVNEAIKEIEKYKQNLIRKQQIFVERLAKAGLEVVQQTMESVPEENKGSYYTEVIADGNGGNMAGAAIRLSGNKILFIEFSAGITFGSAPGSYPLPSGAGYGYGTYPDQKYALSPNGWWYKGEDGKYHHSYGNRSYMPMYHAEEAIILTVWQIAREVFGS